MKPSALQLFHANVSLPIQVCTLLFLFTFETLYSHSNFAMSTLIQIQLPHLQTAFLVWFRQIFYSCLLLQYNMREGGIYLYFLWQLSLVLQSNVWSIHLFLNFLIWYFTFQFELSDSSIPSLKCPLLLEVSILHFLSSWSIMFQFELEVTILHFHSIWYFTFHFELSDSSS